MSSLNTAQGLETKNKVESTALRMGYDANDRHCTHLSYFQ